jgi:aerobic carbon-monoxide dehydrogenase medium subunit
VPTLLPRFTIDQPTTLADASEMLLSYGETGRPYAGGTELLLAMKTAGLRYEHLVDLKTVPGLDGIEERDGAVRIGALATHLRIEPSPIVYEHLPTLARLEAHVANPRVRATGTLGGNLCFGEPHSDPAALLLCLDARLELVGPAGERELAMDTFIVGPYETALAEGELLRAVTIPIPSPTRRAAYRKLRIREWPMLGLALVLDLDEPSRQIGVARVAVASASPTPRRSAAAEDLLVGAADDVARRLDDAAEALADDAELLDDLDGSAEYKRHLIHVFLRQAYADATSGAVA